MDVGGPRMHRKMRTSGISRFFSFCLLLFPQLSEGESDTEPGSVIQDILESGQVAPAMSVLPAGTFMMGSAADEVERYVDEGPQHQVTFEKPFALGRTEVTVGQFRVFIEDTGYVTSAERGNGSYIREPESGLWRLRGSLNWRFDNEGKPARDDAPVVHVSWDDAKAYATWLSQQTGQRYRLPTEAEFEYANRAGSTTRYWWGDGPPKDVVVNVRGELDESVTPLLVWPPTPEEVSYLYKDGPPPPISFKGYGDGFGGLAPVGSFKPNGFGLFDTTGNVWEWTEDCWHDSYVGAPGDGSAWTAGPGADCTVRVLRGASYYCFPRHVRSANRWFHWTIYRSMYVGFRVAREL